MTSEPRGYWTRVFDQAATLLRDRPDLKGDSAYWMARRLVDQSLAEQEGRLSLFPNFAGSEEAPVLELAP